MKFSCQRCGKKYFTGQDLRGDRVYKMTCKVCGHPIVIRGSEALEKASPAPASPGSSNGLQTARAPGPAAPLPFPGLSDDPFAHPLPPPAGDPGAARRDPAPPATDDDELQVEVTVDPDFPAPGDDLRFEPVAMTPPEPRPKAQVTLWRPPPDPWPPPRTTARIGVRTAAIAGLAAVSLAAVVVGFLQYGPQARLARPAAEVPQEAAPAPAAPQGATAPPTGPAGEAARPPPVASQPQGSLQPAPVAATAAPPREAGAAGRRREQPGAKPDGGPPRSKGEADLARAERERAARVEPQSETADDEDAEPATVAKPPVPKRSDPGPGPATEPPTAAATPAPAAEGERGSTAPVAEMPSTGAPAEKEAPSRPDAEAPEKPVPEGPGAAPSGNAVAAPRRGLDAAQIAKTLDASRPSFESCLAAAKGDKALDKRGRRLVLTLLVHANGRVTDPAVDDPAIEQTDLGGCLRMAGRAIVFPAFEGEPQRVTVPLAVPRP